jgi:hypothetical protein
VKYPHLKSLSLCGGNVLAFNKAGVSIHDLSNLICGSSGRQPPGSWSRPPSRTPAAVLPCPVHANGGLWNHFRPCILERRRFAGTGWLAGGDRCDESKRGRGMRKLIAFDDDTADKLIQLGRDRMATLQELADEAFADMLKKYGIPIDLKDALRKSARAASETASDRPATKTTPAKPARKKR